MDAIPRAIFRPRKADVKKNGTSSPQGTWGGIAPAADTTVAPRAAGCVRVCSFDVDGWVTPAARHPGERIPDTALNLVDRVQADILLLQGYTAFPDSLTDLMRTENVAPNSQDDAMVKVGFDFVDDILGRSISRLTHSVKRTPRTVSAAGTSQSDANANADSGTGTDTDTDTDIDASPIYSGVAIYSRRPIRHYAGVSVGDTTEFARSDASLDVIALPLALGAEVGSLTVYTTCALSSGGVDSLCRDVLRRRRNISRRAYIIIACSYGDIEYAVDKLRTCGMMMLGPTDKPQFQDESTSSPASFTDSIWVSLELFHDYDVTLPSIGGSLRVPVHELASHAPLVIDLHKRLRLGVYDDARSLALLTNFRSVLENCLAFNTNVDVIGGPHVIDRVFGSPARSSDPSRFVMYTNRVPNGIIRRMPLPDAATSMNQKQIAIAWASGGVTVEALNGWWVMNVGRRRYVWGYMLPLAVRSDDSVGSSDPLLVHYAKEYRYDMHSEYVRWLASLVGITKQQGHRNNVRRRACRIPSLSVLRHFSANTDVALCNMLSGCGVRNIDTTVNIFESNSTYVREAEAEFSASTLKLNCLKKSHDVWVRFTELNAALAAGRPELADRSGIEEDFDTLWRPVFEYYNTVLIDGPRTLSSSRTPFIMFRSQAPGSGFVFDDARRLEDMRVGDVVQTSTFVFTTYAPAVQTIVLSKSSDMEVVFVVPPHLVRELLILSRATQNMVGVHNLPCLFMREEVMIPPFAMHRILCISAGYVSAPYSDAPNTTHSGTRSVALKKISMYIKDKLSKPDAKSSSFFRRFYVVEMMGFSRSRIAAFDKAYGTNFKKLYAGRTLVR